jgi:hypothetical protein
MTYLMQTVVPFFSGMVIAINLTFLLNVNSTYEAAWWKVWLALGMAVVFPLVRRGSDSRHLS